MAEGVAAIAGTGLIGASIGLGLARAGWKVIGWDPDAAALEEAQGRGAVTAAAASVDGLAATEPDILVLAGPPQAVPGTLRRLSTDALVTDVAGVKMPVVAAGGHLPRFVPGHPLAGREVSGPGAASATLFHGAAWAVIVGNAPPEDVSRVEEIVAILGAYPVRMTAREHDEVVAMISHLPQLLASTLVTEASRVVGNLSMVGNSFRDLTRVAASDPALWSELLALNGLPVAAAADRLSDALARWAELLRAGATDALADMLTEAGRLQAEFHPPVQVVEVSLLDRPGELAAVGRALDSSRADVRDVSLRHAPHGGGGLLKVFVRSGDVEPLTVALEAEGLTVSRIAPEASAR